MKPTLSFSIALSLLLLSCAEPVSLDEPTAEASLVLTGARRTLPLLPATGSGWIHDPDSASLVRVSTCGDPEPTRAPLALEIDPASLPDGARLESVFVVLDPCDVGRDPFMPSNVPAFDVRLVSSTGAFVNVFGATDPSPTVSDYAKVHRVGGMLPAPLLVDRSLHRVVVFMENEYGDHAVGGLVATGLEISVLP